jgi:hypothetical protein
MEVSASSPYRFNPDETVSIHNVYDADWAPEPVWTLGVEIHFLAYQESNVDPSVVYPVRTRW